MSDYSDRELLSYVLDNGIINRATIEEQMHMKENDIYLSMHKHKIWQGNDGYWRTKVNEIGYGDNLRLIKKRSKTDLNKAIVDYYKSNSKELYSFKARFEVWVKRQETCGRSSNTICKYRSDYKKFFSGYTIEEQDIRTITDEDICKHLQLVLTEKSIKWRALKDIFGYMCGVFNKALIERVIDSNPCMYVDLPLYKRLCSDDILHSGSERTLSKTEMDALRNKIRNPKANNNNQIAGFAIELSMLTGMRVGELAGLMWDDILFDEGIMVIRHSERYDRKAKQYYVSTTKNGKARIFPLTNDILELLERVSSYEKEHGWFGEFVFTGKNGKIHVNAISSSARNRTMSGEFGNPKSIHAIRRTFNSNLRCAGVSPTVAASLLGHTERVNENNYTYDILPMQIKREYVDRVTSNRSNRTHPIRTLIE